MKKIIGSRASGKTVQLVKMSSANDIPIVVMSNMQKCYLHDIADRLRINIPEPIVIRELKLSNKPIGHVYIDEAEHILDYFFRKQFGLSVLGFTMGFLDSDILKIGGFPHDDSFML